MSEIYFTSDLHFDHSTILTFCDRPVGELTNEEWLMGQIAQLPKGSTLWHLGDLCFAKSKLLHDRLVEILKFIIVDCGINFNMILGNHDRRRAIQKALVEIQEKYGCGQGTMVLDYYEVSEKELKHHLGDNYQEDLGITAKKLVLFHFPIQIWNQCQRGSIHFHGHSHGDLEGEQIHNRIDVGIDSLGKIMTLKEVIETLVFRNKSATMYPKHH